MSLVEHGLIELVLSVALFTGIVAALAAVILFARHFLAPSGNLLVTVNGERELEAPAGDKLLGVLTDAGLLLASACGGKGTCGQCRVTAISGGGEALPTEAAVLARRELNAGTRLACQLAVKQSLSIEVPEEVFGVRKWRCRVRSNHNVATFVKELVLELPAGETLDFRAGGYVQIECPPHELSFRDFVVDERFRAEWDRHQLWAFRSAVPHSQTRAYSMANYPLEDDVVMLNVRIATPPPGADASVPPGVVSSFIFALQPGDEVDVSGPFGEFFARDTEKEMIFVGGGAGMAPMRSHIFDQLRRLRSGRRISFWYGARAEHEVFYRKDFDDLAREFPNFSWTVALSDPTPADPTLAEQPAADDAGSDAVHDPRGFIHEVLHNRYLKDHEAPEDCEYYLCGPPIMVAAVTHMLLELGVDEEDIMYDDFG